MRLLLIVNVRAGTVTPRKVRFIETALGEKAKVERARTRAPGHATELARRAADGTHDAVAVLGGDGTVNEVVNGLAGSEIPLGIIPGGGTNVLSRALGIPQEPLRAAGYLLARLGTPPRRIPLGRANGRYYTFACGMGIDGEIVRLVERRQALKRAGGHGYYVWTALRVALGGYDRRTPRLRIRWGDDLEHGRGGFTFAITQNLDPFTYLAHLPLRVCPRADLHLGIDCFAGGRAGRLRIARWALGALSGAGHVRDRRALYLHDQRQMELSADRPMPVQMDGEFVGHLEHLAVDSVPGALAIHA